MLIYFYGGFYYEKTSFKNMGGFTVYNYMFWISYFFIKYKINKFLSEFFENQLPLKPKDRIVELSRHTMREEIKYHNISLHINCVT